MNSSVFISRDETEVKGLMKSLVESGYRVTAKSLIETHPIAFDSSIPKTDWIFFPSGHAVRFFFRNNPTLGTQKMAAVGHATAKELSKHTSISFIGPTNDTEETALLFANLVGSQTVLFPQSRQSLQNIQLALPSHQVINLICYETVPAPSSIGFPDILLFSSPSNVASYFLKNTKNGSQKFIAFGRATAKSLNDHGIIDVVIPTSLTDEALLNAINSASIS